jgi:hypothetical protein
MINMCSDVSHRGGSAGGRERARAAYCSYLLPPKSHKRGKIFNVKLSPSCKHNEFED